MHLHEQTLYIHRHRYRNTWSGGKGRQLEKGEGTFASISVNMGDDSEVLARATEPESLTEEFQSVSLCRQNSN